MSDISKIDKNFALPANVQRDGVVFYNVTEKPFSVHGLIRENGAWARMPAAISDNVNEGVKELAHNTAGGRVRFVTNSPYVIIKTVQPEMSVFPHMAFAGKCGFDLYSGSGANTRYIKSFIPQVSTKGGFEAVIDIGDKRERLLTIDFPLYDNVTDLYVGLLGTATLTAAPDYTVTTPVVYYGSSITQGGCASRAGNSYQGFISRWLDIDYINLGFSGSARAEKIMCDYIASLDMSCFVLDYDHNSPSNEHLAETHEALFKCVRAAHPDIPIVVMNRPKSFLSDFELNRLDIIKRTVENAQMSGDKNVYFVSGKELMALCGDEGTVDGTHPTDLGFYSMAKCLAPLLKELLIK
jgi:hypothetical protein